MSFTGTRPEQSIPLETDASLVAIAAVLIQEDRDEMKTTLCFLFSGS